MVVALKPMVEMHLIKVGRNQFFPQFVRLAAQGPDTAESVVVHLGGLIRSQARFVSDFDSANGIFAQYNYLDPPRSPTQGAARSRIW